MLTNTIKSKFTLSRFLLFVVLFLSSLLLLDWLVPPKASTPPKQAVFGYVKPSRLYFADIVFHRFFLKEWLGEPMAIAALDPCEPERIKTMLENKDKFPATLFNEENGETYCNPVDVRLNMQHRQYFMARLPDVNGCDRTADRLKALLTHPDFTSLRVSQNTFAKYQPNMSRNRPRAYRYMDVKGSFFDSGGVDTGVRFDEPVFFSYLDHVSENGFCTFMLKFKS